MNFSKEKIDNVKAAMRTKFIRMDDYVDMILTGLQTGYNCFAYGPGGFAKSEASEEILKICLNEGLIDEEPFIMTCGPGTTQDQLYGGLNMPLYKDTGIIEYLPENSWMARKYVIFEELLDAPVEQLQSLKDILTSKMFRFGNQQYKIRTVMIIVNTNRSKLEVSDDNSAKAFLERFQLEMEVRWSSYETEDFADLFEIRLGDRMLDLAAVISKIHKDGGFISPRTAVITADIIRKVGIRPARFVKGVDVGLLDTYEEQKDVLVQEAVKREKFDKLVESLKNVDLPKEDDDIVRCLQLHIVNGHIYSKLGDIKVPGELEEELKQMRVEFRKWSEQCLITALENSQPLPKFVRKVEKIFTEYEKQ